VAEASVILSAGTETLPVRFRIKVLNSAPGRVDVFAFHNELFMDKVTLVPEDIGEQQAINGTNSESVGTKDDRTTPDNLEEVPPRGSIYELSADLTLVVQEHNKNGKQGLRFSLTAKDVYLGLKEPSFGEVLFEMEPKRYFQDLFVDFENLRRSEVDSEERLSAIGESLFQAVFPENLRNLLWARRHYLRSIEILSQDPRIPWELCKLHGPGTTCFETGEFLCEAFNLTRWSYGKPHPKALRMERIAVIYQEDSGLESASGERDFLLSLRAAGHNVELIQPNYLQVREMLASGLYHIVHFTGHGFSRYDPHRSQISLSSFKELRPQDLTGKVANLGNAAPLIFLNACGTGQSGFSLAGIGGWAQSFLDAGAAAFIGPYWHVPDEQMSRFAKSFYPKLLAGDPIGEAVRQTRLEMRQDEPGNPSRLAYTLFSAPAARVVS
jgi:hypothetical protein